MSKRRASRELALQVFYALDINAGLHEIPYNEFCETVLVQLGHLSRSGKSSGEDLSYLILAGVRSNIEDIDRHIDEASDNRTMERLSIIDRNILRMAVFEMLYVPDVPPRVAINEAIEIAKSYESDNYPKFMNGVLERIYRILKVKSRGQTT